MRKFRSVTSASDANLYVGPFGEIVVDDAGQLRIQDNVTAGGHLVGSDTGNITFVDSTISTSDISSNIVIDSDRLTVTNAIAVGNLLISNNNIFASSNVLSVSAGNHSFVFRDVSEGFNQGTGAILKFDNVESYNGPTFETWYGETGNPFDPPGQHSLDIRVSSNAAIDYVEFASYNWDNYMGLDNQTVFIHTNWNTDPQQSWRFNTDGEFVLPTQGIIRSFNNSSQLIVTDTSVKITSTNQTTAAAFNLLIQDSNFVFEGNVIPSGNVVYDLGTPENQWRHLYVSSNTIYIGGTPISVSNGELTVDGNSVTAPALLRTVAKTGSDTPGTGDVATITLNPANNVNFVPGSYPGIYIAIGTGFSFTLDVALNGDLTATVIGSGSGFQFGDNGVLNGGAIAGGTSPTDDVVVTVATLSNIAVATPLDLTKQVQKLTDGYYSLADGVEGQMIYLVPQNGTAYNNVTVSVANGRLVDESNVGTVYTNIDFFPFRDTLGAAIKNIVTLIFTDSAWQASSGQWD